MTQFLRHPLLRLNLYCKRLRTLAIKNFPKNISLLFRSTKRWDWRLSRVGRSKSSRRARSRATVSTRPWSGSRTRCRTRSETKNLAPICNNFCDDTALIFPPCDCSVCVLIFFFGYLRTAVF